MTKAKEKATTPKKSKTSAIVQHLEKLVSEGKYSRKELFDQITKQVPEANPSTINTYLTDCKNPKYNSLSKLVVVKGDAYTFKG